MEYDHEKEVIVTELVDLGDGRKTKMPFIITRKYLTYIQRNKIKSLYIEIGELKEQLEKDQAEKKELEDKVKDLTGRLEVLRKKNEDLISGVRESELIKKAEDKLQKEKERNSSISRSNNELIMKNIKLERELQELREGVK